MFGEKLQTLSCKLFNKHFLPMMTMINFTMGIDRGLTEDGVFLFSLGWCWVWRIAKVNYKFFFVCFFGGAPLQVSCTRLSITLVQNEGIVPERESWLCEEDYILVLSCGIPFLLAYGLVTELHHYAVRIVSGEELGGGGGSKINQKKWKI